MVYDTHEPSFDIIDIDPGVFCAVILESTHEILKAAKCLVLSSTEERKGE